MPRPRATEETISIALAASECGIGRKLIARELGVSVNTVYSWRVLRRCIEPDPGFRARFDALFKRG